MPTTIGLICRGRSILLLRRAQPPAVGAWDTVGGFRTAGETAEQNLVRMPISRTSGPERDNADPR